MRMSEGRETFNRLLNWDRGQAPSERLAAILLSKEGFKGIDPSHPLGGKDGLKDMTLSFDGKRWIGAVYFPRGQQSFSDIKEKFAHDLDGVKANNAEGLAFVTNQELRLGEFIAAGSLTHQIFIVFFPIGEMAKSLFIRSFSFQRFDSGDQILISWINLFCYKFHIFFAERIFFVFR